MNKKLRIAIERLAIRRTQLGLSQEKLAELCYLSPNYIGYIERCEKKPSATTLFNMADALDMKLEELFQGL